MTAVAALYSGGRDSTLAALLLAPFYDVTLCSCTFGIEPLAEYARPGADALGLSLETIALEESVAREATERMVADGYPRRGIQRVHEHALETVAAATDAGAVADGTRRDDRVPVVDRSTARSLEDRRGIDYLRPLAGYGRGAVDDLAARELVVETGPSERLQTGDYETELRSLLAAEHDLAAVDEIFPEHVQSRVVDPRVVDRA
jgi:predicted subunit of tRNA(5-methylaminomethyl-2-thiouridylate) methyltransferase